MAARDRHVHAVLEESRMEIDANYRRDVEIAQQRWRERVAQHRELCRHVTGILRLPVVAVRRAA